MIVTSKQEVTTALTCPECGSYSHVWGHLKPGESFGPWYCDDCGLGIKGTATEDGADIQIHNVRKVKTLVLLRLYEPLKSGNDIHIVVEGMAFSESGKDPSFESDAFFYSQHQCPWNYLRLPLKLGDDTDPHGVFQHQETVLMPENYDDLDSFDNLDGWSDIFPSLRNGSEQ